MISEFLKGADVSFLDELESKGKTFYDGSHEDDCLVILQRYGINSIRLRVWNNPKNGFCGLARTLDMAKRVKDLGMTLCIDFHYSDWWADPGKQFKPQAWASLSFTDLVQSVYRFTYEVLSQLKAQGIPADFVQIGNEVTYGLLWDDGKLPGPSEPENADAWIRFGRLIEAGIQAVRDCQGQDVDVMLHIDRGADNAGSRFFFDHVLSQGIPFDTIGLSYYPWFHGSITSFQGNILDLANRYQKNIVLVETAYPWTEADFEDAVEPVTPSVAAQTIFLETVMDIVKSVPNGLGKGVFYWEPDCIPSGHGSDDWHKMALFDQQGRRLPALEVFNRSK